MDRFIAIDNVCAWPNLTLMPDGAIVATIFNQPTHGGWEGDVECWASTDDGRTWEYRGTPAPHEPGTNRMNVAAGLAHDGTFVVIASGWSRRGPIGQYSSPHDGEVLPMWVCRSADGGVNWEQDEGVAPPAPGNHSIPFGDIVQLPDGVLGVCIYTWAPPREHSAVWYVSADEGRTWQPRGTIRRGDTNETTPIVLPDDRVLVVARTLGDQHLQAFVSEDWGATWVDAGPVTLGGQHPGHLLGLADGRLLLSYGLRNAGLRGVGIRLSEDDGATWQPPRVLVQFPEGVDCGYPSAVQTVDGTIVSAWYCRRVEAHTRYHVGVARWTVE